MVKKTFIIIILIISMFMMTGCQVGKFGDRMIYLESTAGSTDIYYDKETKVMYMQDGKGHMTPMVDSEGNVLLKE